MDTEDYFLVYDQEYLVYGMYSQNDLTKLWRNTRNLSTKKTKDKTTTEKRFWRFFKIVGFGAFVAAFLVPTTVFASGLKKSGFSKNAFSLDPNSNSSGDNSTQDILQAIILKLLQNQNQNRIGNFLALVLEMTRMKRFESIESNQLQFQLQIVSELRALHQIREAEFQLIREIIRGILAILLVSKYSDSISKSSKKLVKRLFRIRAGKKIETLLKEKWIKKKFNKDMETTLWEIHRFFFLLALLHSNPNFFFTMYGPEELHYLVARIEKDLDELNKGLKIVHDFNQSDFRFMINVIGIILVVALFGLVWFKFSQKKPPIEHPRWVRPIR
jgi:hypothetical protein